MTDIAAVPCGSECQSGERVRGMCRKHYQRWKRLGSTELPERIDRFMAKVLKTDAGCWLWTATKVPNGYGEFFDGRGLVLAHRWAYEHFVGPIPEGLHLDHLCCTRNCVNPAHLEAVTQAENNRRANAHREYPEPLAVCHRGHQQVDGVRRPRSGRPGKFYCGRCAAMAQQRYQERRRAA